MQLWIYFCLFAVWKTSQILFINLFCLNFVAKNSLKGVQMEELSLKASYMISDEVHTCHSGTAHLWSRMHLFLLGTPTASLCKGKPRSGCAESFSSLGIVRAIIMKYASSSLRRYRPRAYSRRTSPLPSLSDFIPLQKWFLALALCG